MVPNLTRDTLTAALEQDEEFLVDFYEWLIEQSKKPVENVSTQIVLFSHSET